MLYILGVGEAAPPTVIDNALLASLSGSSHTYPAEISERRSIVPRELLVSLKGESSKEALLNALVSPTDLSLKAAQKALAASGVTAQQIGTVIGDCSTAMQTCPSEGQRLAGKLGLKIPAYDITAASGGFVVHLDTLCRWKAERMPEYVLCVTTHAPTHAIDYRKGLEGYYFGDGSASFVLSMSHTGKLKVLDSDFKVPLSGDSPVTIGLHGHLTCKDGYVESFVLPHTKQVLEQLRARHGVFFKDSFFIGPQCAPRQIKEVAESFGFHSSRILGNGQSRGDCFGASAPAALSSVWDAIQSGQKVFVVQSGMGLSYGYVVLEGV